MPKAALKAPPIINQEYEIVPVSDLKVHPRNANQGDIGAINESLKSSGFFGTIVVQRSTNYILAGNHRLIAAEQSGMSSVPVVYVDVDDERAIRILLADNRTTRLGNDDPQKLTDLLASLVDTDEGLAGTGYSGDDLDQLLADLNAQTATTGGLAEGADPDDIPEPEVTRCLVGDIWQLGDHRLICGDSTDNGAVTRLMQADNADCMWTDPPYGVSYTGKTKDALTIQNDGVQGLEQLLEGAFRCADQVLKPGAAIYIAHPPGALSLKFGVAFINAGWRLHQTLVWVKNTMVLGHSDHHYKHEPIYYGYKPLPEGGGRAGRGGKGWYGNDSQVSVFDVDRPAASSEHPTMKPVELVSRMLTNSCPVGGLVYEPFGGSGTTLIAAETLGMHARSIELDPHYCDVILTRWENATKKSAVLIERANVEA